VCRWGEFEKGAGFYCGPVGSVKKGLHLWGKKQRS
jgi:hypothetical protein